MNISSGVSGCYFKENGDPSMIRVHGRASAVDYIRITTYDL